MNFNEEMERELLDWNFDGKFLNITPEDKGTPEDWAILEQKIAFRTHENEIMMMQSKVNASRSVLG